MADIIIDTHTAIWYFANSPNISRSAAKAIDNVVASGDLVLLSTISIVEIIYLIDKGKLVPQTLVNLMQALRLPNNSFISQELTDDISQAVAQIPRQTVPDMPDRIISATALHLDLPLVTKDRKIQALKSITTIW